VARIRQLRVRLSIPASQLQRDTFAKAWTAAFLRELFAALTHPHNTEISQFQSRAEYVAAVIRDLLDGVAGQRCAYEEFEHLFNASKSEAVLSLFRREQPEAVPILLILEDWGLLERLIAVWDEASLEQLFFVLARENEAKEPSIKDMIRVAQLLLEYHPSEIKLTDASSLTQGRIALKLFLNSARQADGKSVTLPGTIFEALRILRALLDLFRLAANSLHSLAGPGEPEDDSVPPGTILSGPAVDIRNSIVAGTNGEANLGPAQGLLNEFWSIIAGAPESSRAALNDVLPRLTSATTPGSQEKQLAELWNIIAAGSSENRIAFAALVADLTSTQNHGAEPKWISTDCAGLFLLIRVLNKLVWEDQLVRSFLGATYGPRLLTYTLAGVALAILGRFNEELTFIDPGIALFSGWIGAPDLHGFHSFLAKGSVEIRQGLLGGLLTQATAMEYSHTWQTCFDALANYLIQEFTEQIRCFGKPSRSFVVKNFVALPGRILIEENRLLVKFTSSPLHVVVHMSGLDDQVEPVGWLGGRRIEFQADGF
jgi:hypothetical protein